jgi:hypothetical protein
MPAPAHDPELAWPELPRRRTTGVRKAECPRRVGGDLRRLCAAFVSKLFGDAKDSVAKLAAGVKAV